MSPVVSISLLIASFTLGSCVHTTPTTAAKAPSEPTKEIPRQPTAEPSPVSVIPETPPPPVQPSAQVPPKEDPNLPPIAADCEILPKFVGDEPVYLNSLSIVFTRISSPCRNAAGAIGHRKNAGWMAMGFPCTGGEGRIDWKGTNYNLPKMVSFLLETSCGMAPTNTAKIKAAVTQEIGISPSAPMIAFTPFVVQYWEIPGYEDADTTYSAELRSKKGLTGAWAQFIKQRPLKVFLVGRENAWVSGNFMYAVDADLIWVSKNRFMMKVTGARELKGVELSAVKARCEALRPERECSRVF